MEQDEPRKAAKRAVTNIVLIGLVSLFMDMSTEMAYPLIPLFLTTALGAGPAIVGVIEGIAESAASLLKVFSGYIGDVRQNRKRLAFTGYAASVFYKILLLLSTSWAGVLVARVVDRAGKGVRTAPRDALVAQSSAGGKLGGSFGLHKTLDMAGASLGALLAFAFVAGNVGFRSAFLWSIVPALVSVAIIPFIRERKERTDRTKLSLKELRLEGRLKLYLAVLFLFCLGNSSNAFLLLKAQQRGFTASEAMLLYLAFNASASLLAWPSGRLSDRFGRRAVLAPGYLIYGLVYLGFAVLTGKAAITALFVAYGAYTACIGGAERALVAEAAPEGMKGTVLGLYGMLQGIGLLLSSIIAGLLWDRVGPDAPFWFGGALGLMSAAAILFLLRANKGPGSGFTERKEV